MANGMRDPVKDYLSSAGELRAEKRRLHRKLKQLRAQTTSTTPVLTGMPHGSGEEGRGALYAALADVSHQYDVLILAVEKRELELMRFIDRLPTPASRVILKARYCEGRSWAGVQQSLYDAKLYYSDRWIYKLHGKALQEARELYEEDHRHGEDNPN